MSDAIDVRGLTRLDQLCAALGGDLAVQLAQAAAAPIFAEAQRLVPQLTSNVLNHLQLITQRTHQGARATVQVADSQRGGQAHEAAFIEYGHYTRSATGKAHFVPAEPFMRPAFERQKAHATTIAADMLAAHLENYR